jgi:hypothetical protein
MKQFEFILDKEKEKFYSVFSWLIIITNLAFFIYLSVSSLFHNIGPLFYALLAIILITFAHFFKRSKETAGFLIISLGWFNTGTYWWIGVIILMLFALNHISRRQLIVKVFNDEIIYPSWPERKIKWAELNNVVYKDGLLTIDFKPDKWIQQHVVNNNINEKEFNDFCRQQLNK